MVLSEEVAEQPGILARTGLAGSTEDTSLKTEFNIRPMQLVDLAAVDRFISEQPWMKVLPWEKDAVWSDILRNYPGCSQVAVHFSHGVVGCFFGYAGVRGGLSHFAVHEDYQGLGIGRNMVTTALRWFKTKGIGEVSVTVSDANSAGKQFWLNNGFELSTAEGGQTVIMIKKIEL